MKLDPLMGSAGTGVLAAATAWLAQYGITPLALIMAGGGALLAVVENEGVRWPSRVAIGVFNILVAIFSGPVIVVAARVQADVEAAALLPAACLIIGYLAHSAFGSVREIIAAGADRWWRRK